MKMSRLMKMLHQFTMLICLGLLISVKNGSGQLHFASIGNWGSGGSTQKSVADTLKQTAAKNKLSFLVSPGSNFVPDGVSSLEDKIWETHFDSPFSGPELYLPFYTVLGADDWKGNITAMAQKTIQDYNSTTASSSLLTYPKWTLPNWWYHSALHFQDASGINPAVSGSDVSLALVFIDTHILSDSFAFSNITQLHWDTLKQTITKIVQAFDWTVVVGDTALVSSGNSQGNKSLKRTLGTFFNEHHVDVYISGNDRDLEIIEDGGLTHINCGAGSGGKKRASEADGSLKYFGKAGFCHHTVTANGLTTELIDGKSGDVVYSYTQNRKRKPKLWLNRFHIYKSLPEIIFIPIPSWGILTGRGARPAEGDSFIRVMGSLGLLVLLYVGVMAIATASNRLAKLSS